MPEKTNDKTIYSLLEVTKSIQKTLSERYASAFWVKAEMNKLNHYPLSGHCYPDLIEKKNGKIIAEIRSTLWKDDYVRINNLFLKVLKEPLKNGISILLSAKIMYDPVYGISLRILEIDPSFTMGELEREKQATIEMLKQEGIYHSNRSLKISLLPKKIAIISVGTSKGYLDFMKIIEGNEFGYKFFHMLFPALLQGEKAVESITAQLQRINQVKEHFDVVAIVRGGGGETGLTCYNHYRLAREIALFSIPVITGIGHSTNETVAEMIAFKNAITPTDLADFLIQKFNQFSLPVLKCQNLVADKARQVLKEEKLKLYNNVRYFRSVTGSILIKNNAEIKGRQNSLLQSSAFLIRKEREIQKSFLTRLTKTVSLFFCDIKATIKLSKTKLSDRTINFIHIENVKVNHLEKNVRMMNPENVLKRGYSINIANGKAVKSILQIKDGELLTIITADGKVVSKINIINQEET